MRRDHNGLRRDRHRVDIGMHVHGAGAIVVICAKRPQGLADALRAGHLPARRPTAFLDPLKSNFRHVRPAGRHVVWGETRHD